MNSLVNKITKQKTSLCLNICRYLRCMQSNNIDWDRVDDKYKAFTLDGMEIDGKVTSVYDGDTVHIVFPVFNDLYRWNCRISGVDTPEIRTKNQNEKVKALEARDALRTLILGKIVKVKCGKFDKYGRLLVFIEYNDIDISTWLINCGYARAYDGGKKEPWDLIEPP